jgi:hypothetical protein
MARTGRAMCARVAIPLGGHLSVSQKIKITCKVFFLG